MSTITGISVEVREWCHRTGELSPLTGWCMVIDQPVQFQFAWITRETLYCLVGDLVVDYRSGQVVKTGVNSPAEIGKAMAMDYLTHSTNEQVQRIS